MQVLQRLKQCVFPLVLFGILWVIVWHASFPFQEKLTNFLPHSYLHTSVSANNNTIPIVHGKEEQEKIHTRSDLDVIDLFLSKKSIRILVLVLFTAAILHTFLVSKFSHIASRYPEGSIGENFFHLLGEVEIVFLFWSGILIGVLTLLTNWKTSVVYLENLDFTEPIFVFVIMVLAATKPVIDLADRFIRFCNDYFPMDNAAGFLVTILIVGPLFGSLITEPAAMTVSALILYRQFFTRGISDKLKYLILATLFVNISIGGSLTNFAAPPILMVKDTWGWSLSDVFSLFGWKAILSIVINAYFVGFIFKKEINGKIKLLKDSDIRGKDAAEIKKTPLWVMFAHVLFLLFIVINAHYTVIFFAGFLVFLGFATVTREYQEPLQLRPALLVSGFLAGLITLGSLQRWWIQPIVTDLPEKALFFGSVVLTSFTDNAALTFLASQVEHISAVKQYFVVAGALTGGGLTVIANAPNPAGYSLLNPSFGKDGINPIKLLLTSLVPTTIAFINFFIFVP